MRLYIEQSGGKVTAREVSAEEWRDLWWTALKEARKHWEDKLTMYSMEFPPRYPGVWMFRWCQPSGKLEVRVFVRDEEEP